MSNDWLNLFVQQGREFIDSVSRKGKDGNNGSSTIEKHHEGNASQEDTPQRVNMEPEVSAVISDSELSLEEIKTPIENKTISGSEKDIYESQLERLQEQLVDIMIQKEEMGDLTKYYPDIMTSASELDCLRNSDASKLSKELEKEQCKRRHLEEKLKKIRNEDETPKLRRRKHKGDRPIDSHHSVSNIPENSRDHDKTDHTTSNSLDRPTLQEERESKFKHARLWIYLWYKSLAEKITLTFWNIMSNLADEETPTDSGDDDGPPLSVKILKDNIRRFRSGLRPISDFSSKVSFVLSWGNPAATMLVFMVYLFSIWHGYFVSIILFLSIVQLSANFMYSKFASTTMKDEDESPAENTASWSDRFQVVLHVARKVQNFLGSLSDYLEKIKNLLTWKVQRITFKLYIVLWLLLVLSLALSGPQFFALIGMFLGYKLFIQDAIYKRFPKLRKRYDTTLRLWNELPVDSPAGGEGQVNELEESQGSSTQPLNSTSSLSELSALNAKLFCERYKLSIGEVFVKGWEQGWRASLMNKQRPLVNIKHGRLYLTQNYLCFERSRTNLEKNILLKLSDIRSVNKYKPLFILPGTGMSIEICMKDKAELPYIFGAIYGRDDAYNDIIQTGKDAGLPWASS